MERKTNEKQSKRSMYEVCMYEARKKKKFKETLSQDVIKTSRTSFYLFCPFILVANKNGENKNVDVGLTIEKVMLQRNSAKAMWKILKKQIVYDSG